MTPEILALGLAALTVGAMVGGLTMIAFEKGGPGAMRTGTIVSVVLAVLLGWAASLVATANGVPALWISILPAITCVGAAWLTARENTARITGIIANAHAVKDAITNNFEALDVDDDQVISVVDLETILAGKAPIPSGVSRELISHMRDQILKIGHNVGKYTTTAGRSTVTHTVAVISPRDVQNYPMRVAALYPNWVSRQAS